MTRSQLKTEALRLNPAERQALAEDLLLSLAEADRDQIDAAWPAEARRRDAGYQSGASAARPINDVLDRLRHQALP